MKLVEIAFRMKPWIGKIQAGDFFLFIDDLNSEEIDLDVLADFLRSDLGKQVRLLITMRPEQHLDKSFYGALMKSDRLLVVEPQGLSGETYERFEASYCDSSNTSCGLTEEVKEVCRSADGTYWPILVRLALLVSDQNVKTLPQIYEAAFRKLLKTGDDVASQLLLDVGQLCVDTYWEEGYRSIAVGRLDKDERRLVASLLKAGLLIHDGDVSPIEGAPPENVRFFHDSMQSFLTARGLFANDDWRLLRSAGHSKFANAQSTQLLTGGSELFQMCLQVFGPKERLHDILRDSLLAVSYTHLTLPTKA